MRAFVLRLVAKLGRLCAVLIFLGSCLIVALWASLADESLLLFAASSIVVIPLFTGSVALLIGMLFSGSLPATNIGVTPEDAPELWSLARQAFGKNDTEKLRIFLEEDLNASIASSRRWMGIWGEVIHLSIGLPMMQSTDREALLAVVMHEVGHKRHKDTNGSRNINEFLGCFETFFDFMPPGQSIFGTIIYFLLGDLADVLDSEANRLSRIAELEADRYAADQSRAFEVARSLFLSGSHAEFWQTNVVETLEIEILGSISAPEAPFRRFIRLTTPQIDSQTLWDCWEKSLDRKVDSDSSHPAHKDRIKSLGFSTQPDFEPVLKTSLDEMLPFEFRERVFKEFDNLWISSLEHLYER